jgi:NitT/TauT family transport system substrate-binding protein
MHTRRRILRAVMAFAAVAGARRSPAQTAIAEKVTIASTGLSTFYGLPLVLAQRQGYFKEEGLLALDIVDFQGGSKVLQAIVGGSADIAIGGYDHVVTMQAKGIDLKAFVETMRYPAIAIGITRSLMASYTSPADLRGKSVGVSSPGSSTHGALNVFLEKNGVKPSEVSVVGLGAPSTARAAVESGKVDAISYVDPVISLLEADKMIRIVADTRTRAGAEALYGGEAVSGVAYATKVYIDKHPAIVQAVANALRRSLAWLANATPEQVADAVPADHLVGDRKLYMASFAKFRESIAPPQLITLEAARTGIAAALALAPDIKPDRIDVAATIDNRFMQAALQRAR